MCFILKYYFGLCFKHNVPPSFFQFLKLLLRVLRLVPVLAVREPKYFHGL